MVCEGQVILKNKCASIPANGKDLFCIQYDLKYKISQMVYYNSKNVSQTSHSEDTQTTKEPKKKIIKDLDFTPMGTGTGTSTRAG